MLAMLRVALQCIEGGIGRGLLAVWHSADSLVLVGLQSTICSCCPPEAVLSREMITYSAC